MTVFVLAEVLDLHLPQCRSLKDKRAVLRPVLDGLRNRHPVAVAETDHQDRWQRAEIAVVAVSGEAAHVERVLDEASRFVWSFPELEVVGERRHWLEED
jgi:uncharacterized protein YlxP (DUF503 family)